MLSNDDDAVDLARRMGVPTVVRLASADAGELLKETSAGTTEPVLLSRWISAESRYVCVALQQVDLVLVHIKEHADLRALDLADSLVGRLLEQDKRPLLVSVAGKATVEGEPASSKPSSKFYYPVQSSTIIDGKPGAVLRYTSHRIGSSKGPAPYHRP